MTVLWLRKRNRRSTFATFEQALRAAEKIIYDAERRRPRRPVPIPHFPPAPARCRMSALRGGWMAAPVCRAESEPDRRSIDADRIGCWTQPYSVARALITASHRPRASGRNNAHAEDITDRPRTARTRACNGSVQRQEFQDSVRRPRAPTSSNGDRPAGRRGAVRTREPRRGNARRLLHGRVLLKAGEVSWNGSVGDLLTVPDELHSLDAVEDSVILLTVVKIR